jgi:uncharacterized membrane protein YdfJ with MMPL/SSD domain
MILVFGSFLLGGQRVLQEFGFGLAFAVLVDALVIRSLLVPALVHLTGPANSPAGSADPAAKEDDVARDSYWIRPELTRPPGLLPGSGCGPSGVEFWA